MLWHAATHTVHKAKCKWEDPVRNAHIACLSKMYTCVYKDGAFSLNSNVQAHSEIKMLQV